MNLSEKLAMRRKWNITHDEADAMAAEARALEERVADLEDGYRNAMAHRGLAYTERSTATARAEAAERERKEFLLETQRKEIECNKLASKLNKVRAVMNEVWPTDADELDAIHAVLDDGGTDE